MDAIYLLVHFLTTVGAKATKYDVVGTWFFDIEDGDAGEKISARLSSNWCNNNRDLPSSVQNVAGFDHPCAQGASELRLELGWKFLLDLEFIAILIAFSYLGRISIGEKRCEPVNRAIRLRQEFGDCYRVM